MNDQAIPAPAPIRILVDGLCADHLDIADRGLHYGDGLFETFLVRDGRPCQWHRHLLRLANGARRLDLPVPDAHLLETESAVLLDGMTNGVLKLILTRGSGGRGYRPPDSPLVRRILLAYPGLASESSTWERGVAIDYCRTTASLNPALAGIKHLNRLDSVMARREWNGSDQIEGLMLDPTGAIVGGTMTNLFVWDDRRLSTPALEGAGIAGTVRALTCELATRFGIEWCERRLEPSDLEQADGLFLTNAVVGVWPVRALAGRSFPIKRLPWELLAAVRQAARTPG